MLPQHMKEVGWWKNTEAWAERMIVLKRLFKKLQIDAKSVLFMEKTINDKVLKKLKKSKYNKDIELVNLFKRNKDFLDSERKSILIKITFIEKKMIFIGLLAIALMVLLNYYMLTLEIQSFQENLPPTPNIVSCLLTF